MILEKVRKVRLSNGLYVVGETSFLPNTVYQSSKGPLESKRRNPNLYTLYVRGNRLRRLYQSPVVDNDETDS